MSLKNLYIHAHLTMLQYHYHHQKNLLTSFEDPHHKISKDDITVLTANFSLELGMEVVQEYLNQVMIKFSESCGSFYVFLEHTPNYVLSRLIELVNHNKLNAKVDK